jgi:hypothetical protein
MNQLLPCVDSHTARFERLLPGPIERVWDYLTKPDLQRTWLGVSELGGVRHCEPHRSIEFSMPDSSVVSMELEPRGEEVMLVLTHRRLPSWLAGAGTALAAALLVFSFCRSDRATRQPQPLGSQITQSAPSLNSLHLRSSHFTVC